MIKDFLQYIRYEKNMSSHTVLSYTSDLKEFCLFLQIETIDPQQVHSEHIRQWIVHLMQSGKAPRTIARKISVLKSFWRYLEKNHRCVQNPTLKIVIPKTKKPLPVFFKHKEVAEVLNDPFVPTNFENIRDLLIIEMFYRTGIRLSELIGIRNQDIDEGLQVLKVTGKRNKQRIVPLGQSLCEKIQQYQHFKHQLSQPVSDYLFVRTSGKPLYPKLVYNIVRQRMAQVSTLPKTSPHVLRHSFATAMLNEGADINAVKALLGHSSLAATQVYTHTEFGELSKIYKQAHPRAK